MDQLKVSVLDVGDIFLDPNNPRFWTQKNAPPVSEKRVSNAKVQSEARTRIDRFGIDELYDSILRDGFLLLDRIVVRPIVGQGASPSSSKVIDGLGCWSSSVMT